MEHPVVRQIEQWGYPMHTGHEYVKVDSLKNEVYRGDEILVYEDEVFLVDALMYETIEVLELIGAERKRA